MHMRNRLPVRSTQFSFPMSKYAFALLSSNRHASAVFAPYLLQQRQPGSSGRQGEGFQRAARRDLGGP